MRPGRREARSRRDVLAPVFPGEQATGQREIGQQADTAGDHRRDRVLLHGAAQDAVFVLRGDEPMQIGAARGLVGLDQLPAGEIGVADMADLALPDQIVERAQRLLDRYRRIGMVQLIEIDPIGLQAAQARLDRHHDVAAGCTLARALVIHRRPELGGEDDVLPPGPENLAKQRFRSAAPAVAVGRVEQRDAEVERLVDDGAGLFEIAADAEIVASEPDRRNQKPGRPERAIVHGALSGSGRSASGQRPRHSIGS